MSGGGHYTEQNSKYDNDEFRAKHGVKSSGAMQWSITIICHPETHFLAWPCIEKRRQECFNGRNNDEGGREETSSKAETEVDVHSMKRYERTQARPKARREPRSRDKHNRDDRP